MRVVPMEIERVGIVEQRIDRVKRLKLLVALATLTLCGQTTSPATAQSLNAVPAPPSQSIVSQSGVAQSIVTSPVVNSVSSGVISNNVVSGNVISSSAVAGNRLTNLKSAIERAKSSLSADRLPNPQAARERLVQQMQQFEAYLGGTQSTNAQGWFKFLKWNDLLREVAARNPNSQVLSNIEMTYHQNIVGLEYAPFQAMRKAINDFNDAQRFGGNPEAIIKVLGAQLDRTLELTKSDDKTSELVRLRDLSLITSYLQSANQAPELVSMVRGYYSQPNVRVTVGEAMVNRAIARPVNQPSPVDECVLGTHVLGNSMINGNLFAELLPQQGGVSVRLTMAANFSSNNVGYNRGVKVYTTGSSPVYASKIISITPAGISTQPAYASTNLQTQINSIEHRLRLVRRIASRKAEQQKPEANAIGQHRLQTRLAERFNNEIEQQLAQGGGSTNGLNMLNQDRVELVRLGIPKPKWSLYSTDANVLADFQEADSRQLSAPSPSYLPKSANDIVVELHQSLPINVASNVLSGRTIHSWEMDDLAKQFLGSVPAELQKESESEPWSLTFAEHHPVEVEFEDGLATVSLRILKMARGEQELNQPATVTAKYRPLLGGGVLVFERQGDVELNFVRAPTGIRAVTLRSFLKGKFDRFFRERSQPQKIAFPIRVPNISQLSVSSIALDDGWAQVTVR